LIKKHFIKNHHLLRADLHVLFANETFITGYRLCQQETMAKACSDEPVLPQFPNTKFFSVLRTGYFILTVPEA
jgi:hypothetical protein